ncbi:MAG: transposase [Verrucomicrobiales bacterium]
MMMRNTGSGKSGAKDHSSEERRKDKTPGAGDGQDKPKRRGRMSKADLTVHETRRCALDKSTLPADAQYKGVDRIVVRDIKIQEWNVEFEREVYYSPSEGKRYMAPLPEGWQGEFGPMLRTTVVALKYDALTSETGIVRFLEGNGIKLSGGSVSNILLNSGDFFAEEVDAILRQGYTSQGYTSQGYTSQGYVQSDDTSARVMGKYWHTHIICNENFTVYCTREGKDRMTVIDVLLGREASERSALLAEQFGEKASSAEAAQRIREAMALTYFHEQDAIALPEALITDAAPRYEHLALYHALCWIHDGRHYEKLAPLPENFREQLEDFGTRTGYRELDERIAKTLARKEQLLVVLKNPQVPLHNNDSELAARGAARRRDVSLHSCSLRGVAAMDNQSSIVATAT